MNPINPRPSRWIPFHEMPEELQRALRKDGQASQVSSKRRKETKPASIPKAPPKLSMKLILVIIVALAGLVYLILNFGEIRRLFKSSHRRFFICRKPRTQVWGGGHHLPRSKSAFIPFCVRVPRLELGASSLSVTCSNHLSYTRTQKIMFILMNISRLIYMLANIVWEAVTFRPPRLHARFSEYSKYDTVSQLD